MGELQQKYQQRLSTSASNQTGKPEMQFRLDSYKMELKSNQIINFVMANFNKLFSVVYSFVLQ